MNSTRRVPPPSFSTGEGLLADRTERVWSPNRDEPDRAAPCTQNQHDWGASMTMSATADTLRELHHLHQRAKSLRDRLTSGPKTLAARQLGLANRLAALETSRK